jgi:DNA replication and repair protein RecF
VGRADRRRFLDDTLVALAVKYDALRLELDRVVKQRNTLLKQAGGRLDDEIEVTPRRVGREAGRGRRSVRPRPLDLVAEVPRWSRRPTSSSPARPTPVELTYEPEWRRGPRRGAGRGPP